MMARHEPFWTIAELSAQVALALAVDYTGAPNGRVRDVPDRRTIRYYTTLGLLDRPAAMRGRTALYGPRHLLQLVAIKRLQARGLPLAEIQQQLLGQPSAALRRLARLPANWEAQAPAGAAAPVPEARRAEAFWRELPDAHAQLGGQAATEREAVSSASDTSRADVPDREPSQAIPVQGIRLADAALLVLTPLRPVENDDIEAIRAAAAPLLQLLKARRLLGPHQERGNA
jgi:DNA-binding transcriptional MerR regulator